MQAVGRRDDTSSRVHPWTLGISAGAVLLATSLAGCSEDAGDSKDRDTRPSATTTTSTSPGSSGAAKLPSGAVGEQARWLLDLLRPEAEGPTAGAAQRRFSEQFLAEVSAKELEALFTQMRTAAPFTVTDASPVTDEGGARTTHVRLSGKETLEMVVSVDDEGKVAGLFFRPDPAATPVPEYESFKDMSEDLDDLGTAQVYVGEATDDGCQTQYETSDEAGAAPSGSVFKLVVLSAVADAIDANELAWDDKLVITKETKSLPSGRLQDRPDGSRVSVREAARLMISISDNTAADLLHAAVGRARLRATVHDLGLEDDSMRPLLSTRQFFLLGWGAPDLAGRWADASPEERQRLLGRLPVDLSAVDPADVSTPVWPQGVGWFLTGEEICRLHARLQEQARGGAGDTVRKILEENPGVPVPEGIDRLAFKGGSAPGVMALSYLADTGTGRAKVLVVQVRNTSGIDEAAVVAATRGGLALLP